MLKNKIKISLSVFLICSFINNSFAITIGEKYFESNILIKNQEKIMYSNQNKLIFTTNQDGIVNNINYTGSELLNMKVALGNYYESYMNNWTKRENKYNHTYSNVKTKNITVTSFGVGGHVFQNEIILIQK